MRKRDGWVYSCCVVWEAIFKNSIIMRITLKELESFQFKRFFLAMNKEQNNLQLWSAKRKNRIRKIYRQFRVSNFLYESWNLVDHNKSSTNLIKFSMKHTQNLCNFQKMQTLQFQKFLVAQSVGHWLQFIFHKFLPKYQLFSFKVVKSSKNRWVNYA